MKSDEEGTTAIIYAFLGLIAIIAFISFCSWISTHR